MAFTWSSTGVGQIIRASHLTELHTNIDSIKDNLACITDKTTDNSTYNNTVDSPDNSSANSTYKAGVDSGYDSGVDGSYYASQNSTNNPGYCSSDNGDDDTNHNWPVFSTNFTTEG